MYSANVKDSENADRLLAALSGLIDVCERIGGGAETVSALPMSPGEVAAQYYLPLSGHRGAPHMVPETPLKLF